MEVIVPQLSIGDWWALTEGYLWIWALGMKRIFD